MGGSLLTVVYTAEPDRAHLLETDGAGLHFGRDDDHCEIPIWSAINGTELSRIAGYIWRMDGELWVRNLSTRHGLEIWAPHLPRDPGLPPRRDDGTDRGPARSLPAPAAYVRAPGGCELLVRQYRPAADAPHLSALSGEETTRLAAVPDDLRATAAALCEPLLAGGQLPASYGQVGARTGARSIKRVRGQVSRLCAMYADEVPTLRARVGRRLERELHDLGIDGDPQLRSGVWTFQTANASEPSEETVRRRALALPDYYEVAHLLVSHGLVTPTDVARLGDDADVE